MRTVQRGPAIGMAGHLAILGLLSASVGIGAAGWAVGILCGSITTGLLARALDTNGFTSLGPANVATLTRATLVGGIAALAAGSAAATPAAGATLVAFCAVALVLDGVDGRIARLTGTVSSLGARFDMEVDALLILVLSVFVATTIGAWVLIIGAARYLFVAAGTLVPWMRGCLPARYWRKVVAAVLGVALTVAAAQILPGPMAVTALLVALALLGESFGRDVWWLWRRRPAERAGFAAMSQPSAFVRGQPAP